MKLSKYMLLLCMACPFFWAAIGGEVADKKMVWAHNTPWFRPEDNSLFTSWYYNYPLQSTMDSPTIRLDSLKEELRQAKAAGIDGFFLDLGTDPNRGPFHWSAIVKDYLQAAEGTDFQIGICLDGGNMGVDYEVSEVVRMLKENGGHPNYPKHNGRAVLFTYVYNQPGTWSAEEWLAVRKGWKDAGLETYLVANLAPWPNRSIDLAKEEKYKDAFDAVYMFDSPAHANDPVAVNNRIFKKFCDENGKRYIPTLHPGYYGAWLLSNDFYNPFRGVDFLYSTYVAAKQIPADWFHVTTWNDLMETAVFERAYTFGMIDSFRFYCNDLKGIPFKYQEPKVLLAYHREEIPGSLFRLEAMNLPSESEEPVEISGSLLDWQGNKVTDLPMRKLNAAAVDRTEWLIPTTDLAWSPVLVPEITVRSGAWERTVKAPAVLLVSSWQQNALTINVPVDRLMDFPNKLTIAQEGNKLDAQIEFAAPEKLRRIVLFKNDRPIALFSPELWAGEMICNFRLGGDLSFTVNNGRILRALKKGAQYNGCGNFKWDETTLFNQYDSGGLAVSVAGDPDMTLAVTTLKDNQQHEIKVADLVEKRQIKEDDFLFLTSPDGTLLTDQSLDMAEGSLAFSVFAPAPRNSDSYYVRYESMDGNVMFSVPIFPFGENELETRAIYETPVGMETRCWNMRTESEFLTPADQVPVQSTRIVKRPVSKLTERTAHWKFDGNGVDIGSEYYEGPVQIADNLFVAEGFDGHGASLKFDGNSSFRLRRLGWPVSGHGRIEFWLKPDDFNGKKQSVIYKSGWQDGISVNLLEDGRIEVVRSFGKGLTETILHESFAGGTALTPGRWHKVEIVGDAELLRIVLDGKEDGRMTPAVMRTYGPATVFLGGGMPGYENYRGQLDELSVHGL